MYIQHKFVENIPDNLEDKLLYISIPYLVAIHKCACGCGKEVITNISEDSGWSLTLHGDSVSLSPSIGNWAFPCKSHYYIIHNKITWCADSINIEKRKRKRKMKKWKLSIR